MANVQINGLHAEKILSLTNEKKLMYLENTTVYSVGSTKNKGNIEFILRRDTDTDEAFEEAVNHCFDTLVQKENESNKKVKTKVNPKGKGKSQETEIVTLSNTQNSTTSSSGSNARSQQSIEDIDNSQDNDKDSQDASGSSPVDNQSAPIMNVVDIMKTTTDVAATRSNEGYNFEDLMIDAIKKLQLGQMTIEYKLDLLLNKNQLAIDQIVSTLHVKSM